MNIKDGLKFGVGFTIGKAIGELLYGAFLTAVSSKEREKLKSIWNREDA